MFVNRREEKPKNSIDGQKKPPNQSNKKRQKQAVKKQQETRNVFQGSRF